MRRQCLKSEAEVLTPQQVWQLAIGLLSRREHSSHELLDKLRQRGADDDLAQATLERCQLEQYQSDQRFAEMLLRHCISKGQGLAVLRQLSRQHRLDQELLQQALDSAEPDWFELARSCAHKKFGELAASSDKERLKRMAFLQRRGFNSEQIRYALQHSDS